ncbi:hypothetical protein DWV00_17885 [Trinickia dinghuensis]|uniref:Uncharacterized protein n=1 Tax=Trinickia dinghuensis TaxID=2291023 RepID=A0A3D8JYN1_9BURK|nr:hypothetical protein DWV00_17885 [Trinickia dinghuensis]
MKALELAERATLSWQQGYRSGRGGGELGAPIPDWKRASWAADLGRKRVPYPKHLIDRQSI